VTKTTVPSAQVTHDRAAAHGNFAHRIPPQLGPLIRFDSEQLSGPSLFHSKEAPKMPVYLSDPKFFSISSQFTTFHQASIYSGRRF
jgi:hypothetical protein